MCVGVSVCDCESVCALHGRAVVRHFVVFIVDNEVEPLLKYKTKAERC